MIVEDHVDDCGNDLSPLGPDVEIYLTDYLIEIDHEEDDRFDEEVTEWCHNINSWSMLGSDWTHTLQTPTGHAHRVSNSHHAIQILLTVEIGVDVVECCGGAARVSRLCVRRRLSTGEDFDPIAQLDLNDPQTQKA